MKNKAFGTGILIVVSSLVMGGAIVLGGSNAFFNADAILYKDYSLRLNGTTNVLEGDELSIVTLGGGNNRTIAHLGYSHLDNNNWGVLADNGYFKVTNRIGGLTSINYHISEDLVIKYGFEEYDKPEYYELPLYKDLTSLSFPGGNEGYPDLFSIYNESGDNVTIKDMTFYYGCEQVDLHGHNFEDEIERKIIDDEVIYYHNCKICNKDINIDLSNYKITLGNNESNTKVYTPYNLSEYNGAGTLSFDYQALGDRKSFILTFNDDYTLNDATKNLYINSNHTKRSDLIIKMTSPSKIHDIIFKGGNGYLIFEGEKLSFIEGKLDTEAYYTTIRNELDFVDTRIVKDAIIASNGNIVLEGNADVDIIGYINGIYLKNNITNGNLSQNAGILNIDKCTTGIKSDYHADIGIKGNINISGCKVGILDCTVKVGSLNSNTPGALFIDVDQTKSTSSDRSIGISIDGQCSVNVNIGKLAIYSHSWDYTTGIKCRGGYQDKMFSCSATNAIFGFCDIGLGFAGDTNIYTGNYPNLNSSNFYYYACNDLAYYCTNKPSGTKYNSRSDFNNKFGLS